MQHMNDSALEAVYLFIAELNGSKATTLQGKVQSGVESFIERSIATDSLHEQIWLERLYDELQTLLLHKEVHGSYEGFHWSVPIELDASASMLGFMGVLLGDRKLCEITNIVGDTLSDPWAAGGVSRGLVKKALTPALYGSSKTPQELWKQDKMDYTAEDVAGISRALKGQYAAAKELKDFILENCNPKERMTVKVWNDTFTIECNKHHNEGEATAQYDIFDTETGRIRRISHTKTVRVPDLEQFRRYFVTLLIHCLDSQVANHVAGQVFDKYGFCIDIHDAFIVPPQAAEDCRRWYAECMEAIFRDRKTILQDYFVSIGVPASASTAFRRVTEYVEPMQDLACNSTVLK